MGETLDKYTTGLLEAGEGGKAALLMVCGPSRIETGSGRRIGLGETNSVERVTERINVSDKISRELELNEGGIQRGNWQGAGS